MDNWKHCKHILCIRADNMGDLIMSGPAIRALKETFGAKITVLTSSMATPVAKLMDEIDDVITFDFPWVKTNTVTSVTFNHLTELLSARNLDAAVVFTVYSQNPLPAVMLAYLAGIPNRLAYCRENPYRLLTNWVPDAEPYSYIKHQVQRDLDLVASVGAKAYQANLQLKPRNQLWSDVQRKLLSAGLDFSKKWLIIHAGVSEIKRQFPAGRWVKTAQTLIEELGYQVILTGSDSERQLTDQLQVAIGDHAYSTGGLFDLEELIVLISKAPIMLSVNTGTVHIAAAVGTPVVVLYALTNPQHTPWMAPCRILTYKVKADLRSKNEVISYVSSLEGDKNMSYPDPPEIVAAVNSLLMRPADFLNQEMVLINSIAKNQNSRPQKSSNNCLAFEERIGFL